MRSSLRHLRFLAAFATLHACAAFAQQAPPPVSETLQPAVFAFDSDRAPIVYLRGQWRFQPGDNPRYADPAFDDSRWKLLNSTRSWVTQGFKGVNGYAWYRFQVVLPPGQQAYSLILPRMSTSYQCFADGRLVHTVGVFPPGAGYSYYNAFSVLIDLPSEPRAHPQTISIALRTWLAPLLGDSGYAGPIPGPDSIIPRIGSKNEIHTFFRFLQNDWLQNSEQELALSALYLLAAVVALALAALRRTEREYLWFGASAILGFANWGMQYLLETKNYNLTLVLTLTFTLSLLTSLAQIAFYVYLLRARTSWLLWTAVGALILNTVIDILYVSFTLVTPRTQATLELLLTLPYPLWLLILLVRRARQNVTDARLLLFPASLLFGVSFSSNLFGLFNIINVTDFNFSTYILTRFPFPLQATEAAEAVFLLVMLAILLYRFVRTGRERDRTQSELEAARAVQQVLIPETLPSIPRLTIAAAYFPAQEVGGDFFQILPHPSGDTLIVLGDVSGKGLAAALTVSLIVGALRTLFEHTSSPAAILAGLNRRLCGRGSGFTTCLALRISPTGVFALANAGQIAPYRNGSEISSEPALPLGIDPAALYPETIQRLAPGDHLVLMTDGVPEATSRRELFGFARTAAISTQAAGPIAEAARSFGQTDDITVLSIDFALLSDRAAQGRALPDIIPETTTLIIA